MPNFGEVLCLVVLLALLVMLWREERYYKDT